MKFKVALLVAGTVMALGLLPGSASALELGFTCITNNSTVDCGTAPQYKVEITENEDDGTASMTFTNGTLSAGGTPVGAASSIEEIFFTPVDMLEISGPLVYGSYGTVNFTQSLSTANLPGGNQQTVWLFSANPEESINATKPSPTNGINPGESLTINFTNSYSELVSALTANPAALSIGIHVQAFAGGGSESFVTGGGPPPQAVPEPASGALLLAGAGMLVARARARRRRQ